MCGELVHVDEYICKAVRPGGRVEPVGQRIGIKLSARVAGGYWSSQIVDQSIDEIARLVHRTGGFFFCDLTQSLGKISLDDKVTK